MGRFVIEMPDGARQEGARYVVTPAPQVQSEPIERTAGLSQGALNVLSGAVRGAGSIGSTIMRALPNALGGDTAEENAARRQAIDDVLKDQFGAQPDSWAYKGGKLGAEVMGTAGMGNVLSAPVRALASTRFAAGVEPILQGLSKGLETGGFRVGELAGTGLGNVARAATGAAVGGASAGLVDPNDASFGALVGGAIPVAVKAAGSAGSAVRSAVGRPSNEVAALAQRAQQLGIDIPADRIVNSRALNAAAAGLNYVPFSGRAGTEDLMNSQLNRALSRTFGQDSPNVTQALRRASDQLGAQFDHTLRNNGVAFDRTLLEDLSNVYNRAESELGSDALKPIESKIRDLVQKGESGVIDGQAAYNIKRDLDRIGRQNTPAAFHALELKGVLMDALNRSLGPEGAAAFAKTRQQYGNMLALEKLARNGVEGEVSVARLANMKNINNAELQEIADIAAQFVKPREGQHGAAQRALVGAATFGMGGAPGLVAGAIAGRAANTALNSQSLKQLLLSQPKPESEALGLITQGAYRVAPFLSPSQ